MSGRVFAFFVKGEPVGMPRPRLARRGKVSVIYNPNTADAWKAAIRTAAIKAGAKRANLTGPIKVRIFAYFPRPKAHFRTGKNAHVLREDAPHRHICKPDRDNVDKAVLDALTNTGVWGDDCQVCAGGVEKFYAMPDEETGAYIIIKQIPDVESK